MSRNIKTLFLLVTCLLLTACGFHLRGKGEAAVLPPELSVLSVRFDDSRLQQAPMLKILRQVLQQQARARIVAASDEVHPQLILSNEETDSRTLSVSTDGRIKEKMLEYRVSFRVVQNKKVLLSSQDIHIQRDYSFDPLNVIAKEREERFLLNRLRQQAAQQILRRLSAIKQDWE